MLPHGASSWREILPGAIGAGLFWELAKKAFLLFISTYISATNLVYGSLAAIIAFLTWAYLSGIIFLFGAYLAKLIFNPSAGAARPTPIEIVDVIHEMQAWTSGNRLPAELGCDLPGWSSVMPSHRGSACSWSAEVTALLTS